MRAHDAKSNGVPNARLLCVRWGERTIDGDVYTLDPAGNRTSKQDDLAGVTSNYTYDKIYELTQVTQGNSTAESYSYDPVGNRLSSLGVPSYTVNSSNELTSDSNASYTYDNNGNTTSKTDSTGTTNYTWDFENRLTSVTLPSSGGTATFKYDPFGRRIQKAFTQNGTTTTTNYLYSGDNVVETTDQNGSITAKFAQGQNVDEPLAESTSGGTDYYEADGLGSITSLTSSTGSIAQTYAYDSFGNTTNSTGNVFNPFRYTGRDFDSETGLYYYRARYYNATVGRFVGEDPLGFAAGPNYYAYANDDPVWLEDPFGLSSMSGGKQCQQNCVKPNWLDRALIPILRRVAQDHHETVGIGLNGSGGVGAGIGVAGSLSSYIVVSPNGQAGFANTVGFTPIVGVVGGAGFLGGASLLQSSASSPGQLGGLGIDGGVSAADGLGVGADVSFGSGGTVNSAITFGFGMGGNGHALVITHTSVTPICQ